MTVKQFEVVAGDARAGQFTAKVVLVDADGNQVDLGGGEGGPVVVAWADVTGKPATFAPATHTHTIANVTGLQAALDAKATTAALSALDARVAALEGA